MARRIRVAPGATIHLPGQAEGFRASETLVVEDALARLYVEEHKAAEYVGAAGEGRDDAPTLAVDPIG